MKGRKRKDKKKRSESDKNFEDSKRINTQNSPGGLDNSARYWEKQTQSYTTKGLA
ncbi:hypothetical protein DPMN_014374 [Dreissena polymorpha]|uniref:Uncharacterized protein n=1 Tax=Dreissena polymorpha TaxID=45954 RepID=A0A9D4N5W5_DREPO|nr:hypothetical protein DPMN_014374 [Dreissena polymorpha]